MATSGNTSYEATRDQIIARAMRQCGVLSKGQSPDTEDLSNNTEALNALVLRFATRGMPLWKRVELAVTPVLGQADYTIANSLKVAQVILQDLNSSTQYDLIKKSKYDLNRLPGSTSGLPVHYSFNPNLENGTLTIWPLPDSGTVSQKRLIVVYQKEFDGFFAAGNTPDFPSYWTDALVSELAAVIAPEYGVPLNDRNKLEQKAKMHFEDAQGYGDEDGSIYFMADRTGRS